MAEEPENLTLKLLQEMRVDMREMRAEVRALREEMRERFSHVDQRIDGNTVLLNLLAGLSHDHEQRLSALEAKP